MTYFGWACMAYWTVGVLFLAACLPRFARDSRIIRGRGEVPRLGAPIFKALLLWPAFLFRRGDGGPWRSGAARSLWFYRHPDYDRIAQLERETGLDDADADA